MIYCPKCGAPAEDGSVFCAQCGSAIATVPQSYADTQPLPDVQPPVYPQTPIQQPQAQPYQPPVYQTVYQQPVYTQPPAPVEESNAPGTAGMVLGIIAMAFCTAGLLFVVLGGYILIIIGMILSVPGIGLSIGGVAGHRHSSKGKAVAGLVLNGIPFLFLLFIVLTVAIGGAALFDELLDYLYVFVI